LCHKCMSHTSLPILLMVTATSTIYSLSLHDALPIYQQRARAEAAQGLPDLVPVHVTYQIEQQYNDQGHQRQGEQPSEQPAPGRRSEEHTSELQSRENLVCRLLLEKKNS